MADVTITIDGNTTQLVTSAKKAASALKTMGDGAQQAGDKIQRTGKETVGHFERSLEHMGRLVIGAHAIARALESARDKAGELTKSLIQGGGEAGGLALRGSRAAAKGGFNQGAVGAFIDQISPASQEERASFVEHLAGADLGLSNQDFATALQAVSSGAYTPDSAMEALKKGEKIDIQGELNKLSPAARKELDIRRRVDAEKASSRGLAGNAGGPRVAAAALEASDLANPGLASLRAAASNFDLTGLGGMTVDSMMTGRAIQSIADTNKKMAAGAKRLNASGITDQQ